MKTLARPGDLADLLRRLQTVQPDSAARWGRMSAHQMICHLGDAMLVAADQKTANSVSSPLKRTIVKWIALYAPLHWPAGIRTVTEIDQEIGGTTPQDFVNDVRELETRLRRFAEDRQAMCPTHPIFGPMSRKAWLRWAYLHTDHHLRQFGA
jgi:hypothetical protein